MPEVKDKSGNVWTLEEVQALICQVGSLTRAAKRLGVRNTQILRNLGVQSPTEYVRTRAQKDPQWFKDLIIRCDGKKAAALELNVSVATIRQVLDLISCNHMPVKPSLIEATGAMEKFGSCIFAARLLGTTPNEIKKACPEWRSFQDGTKAGDTSIRTGSIGETAYKTLRQDKIEDSPAEENHNHPGHDFLDSEFGKVNVKASPKSKTGGWSWEYDPDSDLDHLALVLMTRNKEPIAICVMAPPHLGGEIPEGFKAAKRANGKWGITAHEKRIGLKKVRNNFWEV